MNRFSIRDIENLTGIKAHTIRIWEQRYGILTPKRTTTNIRYYDADDLKLALKVALLNNYGHKISRIHGMSVDDMNGIIRKNTDAEFQLQVLVNTLIEATLDVDIDLFEQHIDHYVGKHGIEYATEQLIFLFLEKIGLMWIADRIFPAQEHLVSNVIYRKLAVAIERLPPKNTNVGPAVLLFLPEGEVHDIGLFYVYYLMRKYNKNPIYLGANTPIKEAKYVFDTKKPDCIYIHLTSVAEEFDGNRYLQKVSQCFAGSRIYLSGNMLRTRKYNKPENVNFLMDLRAVREALITL